MMPAFIMIGSTIIPATWPGWASRMRSTAARSLKPTTRVRSMMAVGMPVLPGTPVGRSAGPISSGSGATETWTESWWPW